MHHPSILSLALDDFGYNESEFKVMKFMVSSIFTIIAGRVHCAVGHSNLAIFQLPDSTGKVQKKSGNP